MADDQTFQLGDQLSLSTGLIAAVLTLLGVLILLSKLRNNDGPPCHRGWMPWLGCAIEFGKEPLYFIDYARKKVTRTDSDTDSSCDCTHCSSNGICVSTFIFGCLPVPQYGTVFTLYVAGKRLTFLTDPEDFKTFFQSGNLGFQEAVKDVVFKTAGISGRSFSEFHTKIHDLVKGKLAPVHHGVLSDSLKRHFTEHLDTVIESGEDLYSIVRRTMYGSVVHSLFGKGVLPTDTKKSLKQFELKFAKFDDDFEYGAQLPSMFLREWSESKAFLLSIFHEAVSKLKQKKATKSDEETLLQSIINNIDDGSASNFGVLMLWASLANAIPITFWTLGFILVSPQVKQQVMKEVTAVFGEHYNPSDFKEIAEALRQLPLIKWCILEAIRLRAPGAIARKVNKPLHVKGYTIPAGDMIMLTPFWAHRNPEFFPDPDSFNPYRWKDVNLEKGMFLDSFIAFGGGRYQCPGRWFALMEMHMYVAMFLHRFRTEPSSPLPDPNPLHLVGTQQPLQKLVIKLEENLK